MIADADLDRLGSCLGLELGSPNLAEAILEAAPVIIVVLDADGRIVHYNSFMERLCGRAIAQTRGRDWFAEFVPADEREHTRAVFDAALDAGPTEANVNRILVGDGETRLIEWYDRKLLRDDGEVTGIVAVGIDISERLRAAQAQAEMAEILTLVDASVDEIALLLDHTRTRVLFASASLDRVLGIDPKAVCADLRVMFDRVHPDDRERMIATIGQPIPAAGVSYECRVLRRDGAVRWLVSHLRPLPADSSLPGGIISVSMDITERHEAEEALRRLTEQLEARVSERTRSLESERERLQQILDAMAVYVGLLDDRGQIIQLNAKTRSSTAETGPWIGAAIDAMPGMHYTPESLLELRAALVEAQAGRVARFDLAWWTGPGCLRITDTTLSPVFSLGGGVTEIVATGVDVTARRAAERRLRASLAEKDALLHEVHHRVKNNLQVVASLLYLRSVDAEPSVREVLDECRARIRSMVLIHEHLYLSGQLAGIEMHAFLAKLGEELTRIYAGERRVVIHVEGGGLVLAIERAVPVALIANELLTNALKYAYPDPERWTNPEVRVLVSSTAIEIVDHGVGLPAKLDASTASSLGLRLVQSLARQLDAQLEFERGTGTRIRLVLHAP